MGKDGDDIQRFFSKPKWGLTETCLCIRYRIWLATKTNLGKKCTCHIVSCKSLTIYKHQWLITLLQTNIPVQSQHTCKLYTEEYQTFHCIFLLKEIKIHVLRPWELKFSMWTIYKNGKRFFLGGGGIILYLKVVYHYWPH